MTHAPARPGEGDPGTSGPSLDNPLDQCLKRHDETSGCTAEQRSGAEPQYSFVQMLWPFSDVTEMRNL